MKSTRPGVFEYQLDAAARYVFLAGGARLEGYRSITASGTDNIWNMHYYRNTATLKDGDLVLMDFAPEYRYYTSDIARMWPVNGKYSPVQREMLQFVLDYRNADHDAHPARRDAAGDPGRGEGRDGPKSSGARSSPSRSTSARRTGWSIPAAASSRTRSAWPCTTTDPMHAACSSPATSSRSTRSSACRRSTSIYRYEDVVVITDNGYENFTDFLPTELDEIEKLVGQGGMLQQFPSFSGRDLAKP